MSFESRHIQSWFSLPISTNRIVAEVIDSTGSDTLHPFVEGATEETAEVFTDEWGGYRGIDREHESVKHSDGEYVRDEVHTQGIESFWSVLKRAQMGTFHKISPKHMGRYVREFAEKHNMRDLDTMDQMRTVVAGLVGKHLCYDDLIADNGKPAGAGEGGSYFPKLYP